MNDPHTTRTPITAIGQLYAQYGGDLRRFFERMVRRTQDSEDLVQEVYTELLRYPPREPLREPQAYLYRIAWNVMHRWNARRQREAVPTDPQVLNRVVGETSGISRDVVTDEISADQQIVRILAELPPLYGAALVLWTREGMSYSQIAATLGISVHTTMRYLTRALAHLKNAKWDQ